MYEEIIIAGSGGQGIMFFGTLLCNIAVLQNKFTTFFPSYGAAIRGDTANCSVIISDNEIGSPVITEPTVLIAMSEQSYIKFSPKLKKNGLLFVNSSLVSSVSSNAVSIPATEIALQVGDVRTANMVMLGKFIAYTKIFTVEASAGIIKNVLQSKINIQEVNLSAFMRGIKL